MADAHVLAWRSHRGASGVPAAGSLDHIDKRPVRTLVVERIDNPELTAGLVEGKAKGENQATESISVPFNLDLVVGGFALVPARDGDHPDGRTEEQTAAVAKYRHVWLVLCDVTELAAIDFDDSGYGGTGGGGSEDHRRALRQDAEREYQRAVQRLGAVRSRLIETVACEGVSIRAAARRWEGGDDRAARLRLERRLCEAAEVLVEVFGTRAGAGARRRIRSMGEHPSEVRASTWGTVR